MNSLNSILIEGALVADPTMTPLDGGAKVCRFTVSSSRFFNDESGRKEEVSFFPVEVWNKTADFCQRSIMAGRGVRIVGRLKSLEGTSFVVVGETVEIKPRFDTQSEITFA